MKKEDDIIEEQCDKDLPSSSDKICFGDIKLDIDDSENWLNGIENGLSGCGCFFIVAFLIFLILLSC